MTTDMFDDRALDFKVYLDGVDIPFKQVTIQENAQMPSRATLDLPPHPILNNLPPKAVMHVFYQEQVVKGESDREKQSGWKMLYEGEMIGNGFQRTSGSRANQLQFEGIANWIRTANGSQAGMSQMYGPNSSAPRMAGLSGSKLNQASKQIGTTLEDKWKQQIRNAETVVGGVKNIIEDVVGNNIVLNGADERVGLENRFPDVDPANHISSETFREFINIEQLQQLIKQELGRVQNRKPILNFLQVTLAPIFHEMNFNSSMLRGWMAKPMIRFAPPPSCNVLTHKMVSSQSFSHNFLQETTRTFLQRKTGGQKANGYLWPNDIDWEKFLNIATGDFAADEISDREQYVLTEEMLKGIVPAYKDYSHAYYEAAAKGSQSDNFFFTNAAEHEHHVNKLNSSSTQMSGAFNPEPVPGFPMFYGDPAFDVLFGSLSQVSHTISSSGQARTTYSVDLAQRTLSNPRNLSVPQINPIYAQDLNTDDRHGQDNLVDFYSDFINADVEENSDNEVTLPDRDEDLEQSWHDKKEFPKNPVLGRALTLMKNIMKDQENLGRTFFRRGHMDPKQVFEGFYNTKPMKSGQLPDMWGNVIHDGLGDGDVKSLPDFLRSEDQDVQNHLLKRRKIIEHYVMFMEQQGGSRADTNVWPPDMNPEDMEHGLLADYGAVEEH